MNKYIVYTCGLSVAPTTMEEVIRHAKRHNNFRLVPVETKPVLSQVQAGDKLLTKKGNVLYVIRTIETSLEDANADTKNFLDDIQRNYGLITGKKANVGGIEQVTHLTQWSRSSRPFAIESTSLSPISTTSTTSNNMEKNNSIKNFGSRIKDLFMPTEAQGVRMTMNGEVAVQTSEGWVGITDEDELIAYPSEFVFELPAYLISKPAAQLKVGDIVARDKSFVKVTDIRENGTIKAISFNGTGAKLRTVKDFLLGQSYVKVVVSLASMAGGQFNPMMLALMSKDSKDSKKSGLDSLLPIIAMQNMNGQAAGQMNPMMMLALGGDDFDMKDMFMYSAISGQSNPFGNLFGQAAPVATPVAAPAKAPETTFTQSEVAELVKSAVADALAGQNPVSE